MKRPNNINNTIQDSVRQSLFEDIGSGDITAELIDRNQLSSAYVISREPAVLCGQAWFNEVFFQLDPDIKINWLIKEGETVLPNQRFVELSGNARHLLTGERTALNWLQSLSGTATVVSNYVAALKNTRVKLLDTRKTIPGLRAAQKYAVKIGGGENHRMGLFDAFLIKENHIMSCDPVKGLVQIPCIERNAMGAVKAVNAAQLALAGDGKHKVSLDMVINTMREIGNNMSAMYKETSLGGLAVNVTEC